MILKEPTHKLVVFIGHIWKALLYYLLCAISYVFVSKHFENYTEAKLMSLSVNK